MTLEIDESPLYNKLSVLLMPEPLRNWSPEKTLYSDLSIDKEDISELIELASDRDLFESELEEEMWIPTHAWRILSELDANEAIGDLISLFDEYHDCDYAHTELPQVVAALSKGKHLQQLSDHLHDESRDESSRVFALDAIDYTGRKLEPYKGECVDILASCLDQSNNEYEYLNGFITVSLMRIGGASKIEIIRKAFNQGIVALDVVGDLEDVEIKLGLRDKRETPKRNHFMEKYPAIKNIIENNDTTSSQKKKKLGRNDICPCGSGRKYKKCCIDVG